MVDRAQIREFSRAVAQQFRPKKIVLFGSYAYGKPTKDSDVDLLVIMPRTRAKFHRKMEAAQTGRQDARSDGLVAGARIAVCRHAASGR